MPEAAAITAPEQAPSGAAGGRGASVRQAWAGLGVIGLTAILVPLPILMSDGWPNNHDGISTLQKVEAFRRAFLAHEWYPLWTPFAAHGHGSPYPLFYHRLFATLAAALSMALRSVLLGAKATTVLLLFVGGAGLRRLLRVSGASEVLATVGGVLFLVSPYTLADWLVRGALAEFAALMLLPWAYAELCLFLQGRRRWVLLAAEIVLLFHAHSMIAYFFLVSLSVFFAYSVLSPRRGAFWQGALAEWPQVLLAGVILAVGIIPQVVVATRMIGYFQTDVLTRLWKIEDNYSLLHRYFYDPMFPEDLQIGSLSIEINRYLLSGLLLLQLLPGAAPRWRTVFRIPLYTYLVVWCVICALLQLPAFAFVFHLLPKATFLQFPWRLLSFLSIGCIFLFISAARSALAGRRFEQGTAVVTVVMVVLLSAVRFGLYPTSIGHLLTSTEISASLHDLDGPDAMGEYLLAHTPLPDREPHFITFLGPPARVRVTRTFDRGAFEFTADAPEETTLTLSQFQTPLLALDLVNARLLSRSPSVRFTIELHRGHSVVTLRPRSLWEMLWLPVEASPAPTGT